MGGDLIDRYDAAFTRLSKSNFRSRFHLSSADRKYIAEKGMETIRSHCDDFIRTRLAPANPPNDGKQTPMRGHPVFKAQHACACCCSALACARRVRFPTGREPPQGVVIPSSAPFGLGFAEGDMPALFIVSSSWLRQP